MKKKGKIIIAAVLLTCMVFGTFHSYAADELLGTVVDGSLLTDETEVDNIVYPKARYSYLASGTGSLKLTGTRTVLMNGATTALQSVDKIQVYTYLQRLKNGTWVNFYSGTPGIKYNTYYVSTSNTVTVEGGYYYRMRGAHGITEDSTTESLYSYTNGMWID